MWRKLREDRGDSPHAVNNHALLAKAWYVLARGGDLAPEVQALDPRRCPTRMDLFFGVSQDDRHYAVLWLRPLKKHDPHAQSKMPQCIVEHDGGGSDA